MIERQLANVDSFKKALGAQAPIFASVVDDRQLEFGDDWLFEFSQALADVVEIEASFSDLVNAYASFCVEALRLQREFDRTGKYPETSYSNALKEVYSNYEYMSGVYLPALYLTHYLWPHHYRFKNWVTNYFCPLLNDRTDYTFADVGVGTGFYSNLILRNSKNINGVGYDVSDASMEFSRKLLRARKVEDRFNRRKELFPGKEVIQFDAIVCIELLEHLEDPQELICKFYNSLKKNGKALISAALNAPNRDHIYLYREIGEVAEQIKNAGLTITRHEEFFAYKKIANRSTPSSAVFIVEKR